MNLVVFLSCLVNVSGLQSIICLHLPVGHQAKRRHSVLIPLLERLDVLCNHIVKKNLCTYQYQHLQSARMSWKVSANWISCTLLNSNVPLLSSCTKKTHLILDCLTVSNPVYSGPRCSSPSFNLCKVFTLKETFKQTACFEPFHQKEIFCA